MTQRKLLIKIKSVYYINEGILKQQCIITYPNREKEIAGYGFKIEKLERLNN